MKYLVGEMQFKLYETTDPSANDVLKIGHEVDSPNDLGSDWLKVGIRLIQSNSGIHLQIDDIREEMISQFDHLAERYKLLIHHKDES